jgi:cytoskeleton protein RodZ
MSSLGPYLRDLRERRGLSLEEMVRATRIGRAHLEALEASEFGKLPAPVFTRGFIRAYCQAVGEPPADALSRYESPRSERMEPSRVPPQRDAKAPGRGALLVSFVLLVVLGVALLTTTLVLQSGREAPPSGRSEWPRGETRSSAPLPPAGTSPAETPTRTPAREAPPLSPTPAPSGARATPSTEAAPVAQLPAAVARAATQAPASTMAPSDVGATRSAGEGRETPPYRLIARTIAPTWVRVRTEDGHATEETIPAGETREWVSNRRFTVTVGNAAGVKFELNGRPLPSLGATGDVIRGLVLPTESP